MDLNTKHLSQLAIPPHWRSMINSCMPVIGMSAFFAWQFINMSPSLYSGLCAELASRLNETTTAILLSYLALNILVFLVAQRPIRKVIKQAAFAISCVIICATMLLGTIGAAETALFESTRNLVAFASIPMILWGESLGRLNTKRLVSTLAISHGIGFASALILTLLPTSIQLAIYFASLPISCVCYMGSESHDEKQVAESSEKKAAPMRLVVCFGVLSIFISYLTFFSEKKTPDPDELSSLVAGIIISAGMAAYAILYSKKINLATISRVILPLLTVSFFLIFAFDAMQPQLEVFLIGCTWVYFRLYYWSILIIAGNKSTWGCAGTVAAGQSFNALFAILGNYGISIAEYQEFESLQIVAFIVIATVIISTFLLSDRYLSSFESRADKTVFDPHDELACNTQIDQFANRYNLTERERSICLLILKGHDNTAIRQELVIAQSTLNVHLRNIHRKTGVHSRKELSSLLRSPILPN